MKVSFEKMLPIIDKKIEEKRRKWKLDTISWIDFEDAKQIIVVHIFKKWDLWNQDLPFEPWVSVIISNQLKNIIRNVHTNYERPCITCPFNEGKAIGQYEKDLCSYTLSGKQCSECPLFARWEKTKKYAYNVKKPLHIEGTNEEDALEIPAPSYYDCDIEDLEKKVHKAMKERLSERDYFKYELICIKRLSDEDIARILNFQCNEKVKRPAGYKQIKNLRKKFQEQVKNLLQKTDIIITPINKNAL